MIAGLGHGDIVITSGGMIGKITGLTEGEVTLEVADKVRVKVMRNFITAVRQKAS
jgi:preprotein translocase subunit YajC